MGINCGIIGLPNVGKSTIFNALSGAGAQMASYPFSTIEPNRQVIPMPDERLAVLSGLLHKEKPIPTRIEFVDVAGLVKGASRGEGLGNKFLGHIRNVDALIHVVRCFDSSDASNVMGSINALRDIEVINMELILSDLETIEHAREKIIQQAKSGEKEARAKLEFFTKTIDHLNKGLLLKGIEIPDALVDTVNGLGLITLKPFLYLANIGEEDAHKDEANLISEYADKQGAAFISISGKLEEEISEMDEKKEYLEAMGLKESGLTRLIRAAYSLLGLITFYTITTDLQAWTIKQGSQASEAAGKIHSDFEKGFIRAEVIHYDDLISSGSEAEARNHGLIHSEGREYVIREGDIIHFLFNV